MSRLLLVLLLFLTPPSVAAQSLDSLSPEQRAELDASLDAARTAYEAGDFAAARDAFEKVYAIYPSADVLYRLALCYERLGQNEKAAQAYRDYLVKVPDDPERPRIEGVIRSLQDRMQTRSATLTLTVSPASAGVFIDGAQRLEPADDKGLRVLEIPSGDHEVAIRGDGFEDEVRSLQFSPGENYNLIVSLRPETIEKQSRVFPWLVTGFGGASLLGGAVFLGAALGTGQALDTQYDARADGPRPPNYDVIEKRHNTFVITGWTLAAVGAAASTVGVLLLLRSPEKQTALVPTWSEDGAGVAFVRTF